MCGCSYIFATWLQLFTYNVNYSIRIKNILNVNNVFITAEEIMDNEQDKHCDVLVESDNVNVTETV